MRVTQAVKQILDRQQGDHPGVKANLARILSTGQRGGIGRVVILPVDICPTKA
jgi:class I fructose-bisphosphate aldolase